MIKAGDSTSNAEHEVMALENFGGEKLRAVGSIWGQTLQLAVFSSPIIAHLLEAVSRSPYPHTVEQQCKHMAGAGLLTAQ